mgnify:CR=1 FL=1
MNMSVPINTLLTRSLQLMGIFQLFPYKFYKIALKLIILEDLHFRNNKIYLQEGFVNIVIYAIQIHPIEFKAYNQ